ncbi:hypothetical protein KEM56_000857 [Ascosphaera pollenicola]|nr:hypothetical protein KEM56_000857 [Ascosphaera pollenicola]
MPPNHLRHQVFAVYKELLFLGRDYPQGYTWFRDRLHRAFYSKRNLTDEAEIKQGIAKAEYIKKGEKRPYEALLLMNPLLTVDLITIAELIAIQLSPGVNDIQKELEKENPEEA